MRIILINIQYYEGNNIVPPLGILQVAAQLEKDGHLVKVFDCDPDVRDIIKEITAFNPDVVGLGFLTNTYKKAKHLLKKVRRTIPRATIVLGGVHCSSAPSEAFDDLRPDYLVVGEGEHVMSELCANLERGDTEGVSKLRGVYSWNDGSPVYNGPSQFIQNLDDIPYPARHLLDFDKYLSPPGIIRGYALDRMTTIITSRGCHYSCIYCASHNIFGRRIRRRSVPNVIREIEELKDRYGIKGFYLCDDLFTSDEKWVLSFCEALRQSPVTLYWACQSRVDTLSDALIKGMAAAGCVQIDFGVESGSANTLKTLNKRTTNQAAPMLFKRLREHGIRACATFIIGSPDETVDDVKTTFKFAKELKANYTVFYYSTPYPGTVLHRTAIDRGWLDPDTAYSEDWNHRQARLPVMETTIDRKTLASLRAKMQNRFFIRNYFCLRNLRFYMALLFISILRPYETVKAITGFFSTGRLDNLAEELLRNYRLWIDRRAIRPLQKKI